MTLLAWLRDRAARRHLLGLVLLVGGFCVSVAAQGTSTAAPAPEKSLFDKWLSPDVVIGGALVLLYAGELRGDIGRIKKQLEALEAFKADLFVELDRRYMNRETVEARLASIAPRREHH